jgi:hypothetical protein
MSEHDFVREKTSEIYEIIKQIRFQKEMTTRIGVGCLDRAIGNLSKAEEELTNWVKHRVCYIGSRLLYWKPTL